MLAPPSLEGGVLHDLLLQRDVALDAANHHLGQADCASARWRIHECHPWVISLPIIES